MTTATIKTITVKIDPRNFAKGLKEAKRFGGRYNAADKTWAIALDADWKINAYNQWGAAQHHWIEVAPVSPEQAYDNLHNEGGEGYNPYRNG